ncbi:hypothetical protein ACFL20_04800 [Spirochaetota bacterium]
MRKENEKNIIADETKKRLQSNSWDHEIASAILERKRKTTKRIIYSTGTASLLAAALLFIFLFGIKNTAKKSNYHQFITNQIEGTYNVVFNNVPMDSDKTLKKRDPLFLEDIDAIIDQTLETR